MKYRVLIIVLLSLFAMYSCMKGDFIKPDETRTKVDTLILAGQKDTIGIKYYNILPDIKIQLDDPWNDTDTVISIDVDNDGKNDFSFTKSMLHPSALGGDSESIYLIPLNENEICIDTINLWVDTIPFNDSISSANSWSGDKSLIYSYSWIMGNPATTKGHWQRSTTGDSYYIGIRLNKKSKKYYGWIKLSTKFIISEYAILEEYEY